MLSRIKCYFKATVDFLKYKVWMPHLMQEDNRRAAIIIAGDDYFRISNNYSHTNCEKVYPDAVLIEYHCIYCNKVEYGWIKDWRNPIPVMQESKNE